MLSISLGSVLGVITFRTASESHQNHTQSTSRSHHLASNPLHIHTSFPLITTPQVTSNSYPKHIQSTSKISLQSIQLTHYVLFQIPPSPIKATRVIQSLCLYTHSPYSPYSIHHSIHLSSTSFTIIHSC